MSSRSGEKTEKATPQRRKKARDEGTVAKSQDVGMAASLLGLVLALQLFAGTAVERFEHETRFLFSSFDTDLITAERLIESATRMSIWTIGPFFGVAVLAALIAGFGQVGVKITPKALKPKLSKISPKNGLKRFKPPAAAWEFTRSFGKLALLVAIVWDPLRTFGNKLLAEPGLDRGLTITAEQVWVILFRAIALAAVIGAGDYLWNRHKTAKDLKMSKDEVKREHKDSEGDPFIRAQRRRKQNDMSRNRMMSEIATADVVVTNPTHLAVALRYREGEAAPRVVAKGADRVAARIRAEARRHGLTVTEDKPLARALYRQCRIGQYVPAALYEAVAVVLAIAYRRRTQSTLARSAA